MSRVLFRWDDEAGDWWIDPDPNPDPETDHSPRDGAFVLDMPDGLAERYRAAFALWVELHEQMVAASPLDPADPTLRDACDCWSGAGMITTFGTSYDRCHTCGNVREDHATAAEPAPLRDLREWAERSGGVA